MALTFSLTDGVYTDIDLTAGSYKLNLTNVTAFPPSESYTIQQVEGDVQIAMHQDGVRELRIPVWIYGTRDNALNKAQDIQRRLRQAVRANKDGTADYPVYLKVKEPGATNATLHRVLRGVFDESAGHLNQFTVKSAATGMKVMGMLHLWLYPTGTTEAPLKLNNKLLGSPDMNRYTVVGIDQIPHGINRVDAERLQVKFDKAAVGYGYLEVTTDAANEGIYTDYAVMPIYHLAMGMAYLNVVSGTWTFRLENSSGTIKAVTGITAANQAANADDSVESRDGLGTWYIYKVAQETLNTNGQMRLRLLCTTSSGVIQLDAWQLRDVEPYNVLENPGMDATAETGPHGWEADSNNLTLFGVDTDNYATEPGAMIVVFSQTADSSGDPAGEESAYCRSVLCAPYLIGQTWLFRCAVRITAHGGQPVRMALRDGAHNTLDFIEFTNANLASQADTSFTGDDTETWYILTLSGDNDDAAGVYVIFYPTATGAGDFQFVVDETRLLTESAPVFSSAYVSNTGLFLNRNDWNDTADAAHETYFNHTRLYNLPGNRPALVNMRLEFLYATERSQTTFIGRYTERKHRLLTYQLEGEDFGAGAGTWAVVNDAGYSHGSAHRFTGAGGTEGRLDHPLGHVILLDWAAVPRVIFARARTDNTTPSNDYLRFEMTHHFDELQIVNEPARFTAVNTWELLHLGEMNLYYSEIATNFTRVQPRIQIYARADTSKLVLVDFVWFIPAEPGGWTSFYFPSLFQHETIIFDSLRREVVRATEGIPSPDVRGAKQISVEPGPVSTALVIGWMRATTEMSIDESCRIRGLEIWPQTTTLLGTK